MHRKILLFCLLLAVVVIPLSSPTTSAQSTTVLRVASTANVTTWDPSLSFSTEALYMANIYEPLLWINTPGSEEEFSPALATNWETSEDGLMWTFQLREGVTFHDGAELTSEAVKRSIERTQEIGGASFIWFPLESIEAPDPLTVVMNLSYPAPMQLVVSSLYGAWIISPDALDAVAEDENWFEDGNAAGTGPYMLSEFTPDTEVILTQFSDYWGGWDDQAHFENILISIVSDSVTQEQLLLGGEVDFADRLPPPSYDLFAEDSNFNVMDVQTFFNYLGFLNVTREPLDNALVRQAISYAMPYEDIIKIGAEGRATQARGPVPAGVFPYDENVPQYSQDLDKARELLTEAGHEGGGFELTLTYAAENPIEEAFAPLIKDALAEIGIDVTIEAMLFNQQWELAKGDPENAQDIFLLLYWPTYSDAGSDNLWSMFRSSENPFFNLSYYDNADFDALIDDAGILSGQDIEASQEKYSEAMTMLVDDAPGLFFMDVGNWYAVPTYLGGFEYNPNYAFAQFFYPMYLAE